LVNITLWRDDDNPEFCPVTHLLVMVYILGSRTGFLFPSSTEVTRLLGNPNDSHCSQPMGYQTYESLLCDWCTRILSRAGPWGTHLARKTFYLFAIWGGGSDDLVRENARHKSETSAMLYRQDASNFLFFKKNFLLGFLLELAKNNNHDMQKISTWKPVLSQNLQLARSLNYTGPTRFLPLPDLARNYLEG
jgi:hypothetical protein